MRCICACWVSKACMRDVRTPLMRYAWHAHAMRCMPRRGWHCMRVLCGACVCYALHALGMRRMLVLCVACIGYATLVRGIQCMLLARTPSIVENAAWRCKFCPRGRLLAGPCLPLRVYLSVVPTRCETVRRRVARYPRARDMSPLQECASDRSPPSQSYHAFAVDARRALRATCVPNMPRASHRTTHAPQLVCARATAYPAHAARHLGPSHAMRSLSKAPTP